MRDIRVQASVKEANINTHYMYMFYYEESYFGGLKREEFVEYLNAEGIPCCICFPVLSDTQFFRENDFNGMNVIYDRKNEADLSNARRVAEKAIWLHHRTLEGDESDLRDIVTAIRKIQNYFTNK